MSVECSRCLLTDEVPGVTIGADGLCSVCRSHDAQWGNWPNVRAQKRAELEALVRAARRARRKYDVLVGLSGGKDSTYLLHMARKQFGLRTLAVTYDNGFLTAHARRNIQRAVDALEVDHLIVRFSWPVQQALYRHFFLTTGYFCPACMSGIEHAMDSAAAAHRVPLIFKGTSRRTEEYVSPEYFVPSSPDLTRAVLENAPLRHKVPLDLSVPLGRRIANKLPLTVATRYYWGVGINVPDYVDWDYDEIFRTIRSDLGWESPREDEEHTDCEVDPAVNYIRQRKCPAIVPELTRFSKLVTIGKMSKEEARQKVGKAAEPREPEAVGRLLQALRIDRAQFEEVIADRTRHVPYLQRHYGIRAGLRSLLRR